MPEKMEVTVTLSAKGKYSLRLKTISMMTKIIAAAMPGMNTGGVGVHGPGTKMSMFMEVEPEELEKLCDAAQEAAYARRGSKEVTEIG